MADPSINAKFGLDAGPFRRGLTDVRNRLRGMDRNVNDVNRSVSRLRSGMQLLRTAFVAGGVATFFRSAFARAEELKDSTDANVQAVRRFSEAIDEVKSGFADLAVAGIGSLNRLGEKLGDLINMGRDMAFGGFSAEEARANLEAANRSREQAERMEQMREESDRRRDERNKQTARDTETAMRDVERTQANINRLVEEEARVRDRAFLRGLEPAELAEEFARRTKKLDAEVFQQRVDAANQAMKIFMLDRDVQGETDTEKTERLKRLEEERLRLARMQEGVARGKVRIAEYQTQLAELQAKLEAETTEEKENQRRLDEEAAKRQRERLDGLREEKRLAQDRLIDARQAEAAAAADRLRPTIAEAAEEGRGRIRQLAQRALRDEEGARQAFLRGNLDRGAQLEERARATREQLKGIIRDTDAEVLAGVQKNTKDAADRLEEIAASLRSVEIDASGQGKPVGSSA